MLSFIILRCHPGFVFWKRYLHILRYHMLPHFLEVCLHFRNGAGVFHFLLKMIPFLPSFLQSPLPPSYDPCHRRLRDVGDRKKSCRGLKSRSRFWIQRDICTTFLISWWWINLFCLPAVDLKPFFYEWLFSFLSINILFCPATQYTYHLPITDNRK